MVSSFSYSKCMWHCTNTHMLYRYNNQQTALQGNLTLQPPTGSHKTTVHFKSLDTLVFLNNISCYQKKLFFLGRSLTIRMTIFSINFILQFFKCVQSLGNGQVFVKTCGLRKISPVAGRIYLENGPFQVYRDLPDMWLRGFIDTRSPNFFWSFPYMQHVSSPPTVRVRYFLPFVGNR